jgi:radical SAM superfamily enzyme YgiQ (UPF0313 family)
MASRLLIVQPSHYRSRSNLTIHKSKKRTLVGLTLPYLAALTPREWEITLVDEQLTDIDFKSPVDLVAITIWTLSSLRAYEIADRFRQRGTPVVMGGPHTYFYPEEVSEHCAAVAVGEGETIWPRMLDDAMRGRLEKIYRAERLHDLKNLPFPRYDLLDFRQYSAFKTFSVQTSRSCPFQCEFCSERFYLGQKYRTRPVDEVVEEVKRSRAKNLLFADSNFAGNLPHTMELMEALIPLKITWSSLWPAYLCLNREFMDLAKRSGALHVNIGIESISQSTLSGMNKRVNQVKQYKEILSNLRKRGISYSLNFIFGWDTETVEIFGSTLEFLMEEKVPVAYFSILTPHKGTPLYDRLKAENRITGIDIIERWPGIICDFKPKFCSAQELEQHVHKIRREFYSFPSMFSRLPPPITRRNIASWFLNLSERKLSHQDATLENFDIF